MRLLLASSMSNNIATLVFGKRMKYEDPFRQKMTKMIRSSATAGTQVAFLVFFPWLKNVLRFLGVGLKKFSEANIFIKDYVM